MIDLKHLRTLLALRKTGNLTKAAEMLCLTQSALSQQIRLLESDYGTLFERKTVPIAFTAVGHCLLELADKIFPAIEETERNLMRLKDGTAGTLRIVVECHTCFDWLMPTMDVFRTHWPEVELDIISGFHSDPVGLLHQRQADLAIVGNPEPEQNITYLPLFEYDIVALFLNGNTVVVHARKLSFKLSQLMVMRSEQCLCAEQLRIRHMLNHRPGDRKTVERTRSSSDLIENQQTVRGCIPKNIRHLRHLNHKRTLAACKIIGCPYSGEDTVTDTDIC